MSLRRLLAAKLLDGIVHVVGRFFAKFRQFHVTRGGIDHRGGRDVILELRHLPLDGDTDAIRFEARTPFDQHLHPTAFVPGETQRDRARIQPGGRHAVDCDEPIAGMHAGMIGRRSFGQTENRRHAVSEFHRHAGDRQFAAFKGIETRIVLAGQIPAVRIQGAEHAIDGRMEQLPVGNGIDVIATNVIEHVGKALQLLIRRLRRSARGGECSEHRQSRRQPPPHERRPRCCSACVTRDCIRLGAIFTTR